MVTIIGIITIGASIFIAYALCKAASASDIDINIGGDCNDKRL